MAAADVLAVGAVGGGVVTGPALAVLALPTVWTLAGSIRGITGASVLALAIIQTIQAVFSIRTLFLTLK